MAKLPRGRIKDAPEDFIVEEIPAYEPQGEGEHLYVRFRKRGLTTDDAVRALAEGGDVQARDVGVAGLKDKVGVTTQTVSLPVPPGARDGFDDRVAALSIPGLEILEVKRHNNKLKTGHLLGNRFTIVVRGVAEREIAAVSSALERAGAEGLPNAFGLQRFGRDRDNASQALAWLTGKVRGPRDPRKRRFLWSALQSELFNAVLDRRVADGTWRIALLGDILKKEDSGGLFPCTDEEVDRARAERGEVSPTGPMFGTKMRAPTGVPGDIEREVFEERLGAGFDLASTRPHGEGTRRSFRLSIEGLTVERVMNRDSEKDGEARDSGEQVGSLQVRFVLPKGAYATSVLGAAVDFEATAAGPSEAASENQTEVSDSEA